VRAAWEFLFVFLGQFAGGPGPVENNLVRFGLAALLWAVLLWIAWSRQRAQDLPREKLLVWGFGFGLVRELYMFAQVAEKIIVSPEHYAAHAIHQPIEHALTMASVVVVSGAFLRYVLDDARLARRYLQIGASITALCLLISFSTWPRYVDAFPGVQFHATWGAWLFHAPLSALIVVAVFLLRRRRGWLSTVVAVALAFSFFGEFLFLLNASTSRVYGYIICPISNTFHIWSIPLLGYIYLREQSIEKERVEEALHAYQDRLHDLVRERTAELTAANTRLAAQNAVAATLSQSLDLDTVLNTALDMVLAVLDMQPGFVFLQEPDEQRLVLEIQRGQVSPDLLRQEQCPWRRVSIDAIARMRAVVLPLSGYPQQALSSCVVDKGICTLVSTPLVAKGRAVGAMTLGTSRPDAIQPSGLELLTAIGQQVGVAIENARLYQEAERWAEELALLHQVSLFLTSTLDAERIYDQTAEQAAKLMGCQTAFVVSWDGERPGVEIISCYGLDESNSEFLRTQPGISGLLPDLAADHQSTAIGNAQADPRVPSSWRERFQVEALLCTPIWGAEKPLAYLFLIDQQTSRQWRPAELELIESFVNRAAVALVNAHLHKQLEWAAALEERQRIAADMHDGLAQTLGLLGLRADRASGLIAAGSDGEAMDELIHIREAVGEASGQVRRSIASLQEPPPPRRSLQDLLTDLLEQFRA
jgi:GAF domain-containing protein